MVAAGVWNDLMANHFVNEHEMLFPIDVRILLGKHDYTGLIRKRFYSGEISHEDWKKTPWFLRHRVYDDLCRLAQDFSAGGYHIICEEKKIRWKCKNCPLAD